MGDTKDPTEAMAVRLVFREARASRVAKWFKRKHMSCLPNMLKIGSFNNGGEKRLSLSFRVDDNC